MPVDTDAVLPAACYLCDNSLKKAVLPGHNDAGMDAVGVASFSVQRV